MTLRFTTALAAALVAGSIQPAFAQQAGIAIALVDAETGKPLAGVSVRIENAEIGFARSGTSDAHGMVRLDGLITAGHYRIAAAPTAAYAGSEPVDLTLRANFDRSVTLRLGAAGAAPIVVTAARITGLNTVNAEVSASLRQEELAALPIEGRDVIGATGTTTTRTFWADRNFPFRWGLCAMSRCWPIRTRSNTGAPPTGS